MIEPQLITILKTPKCARDSLEIVRTITLFPPPKKRTPNGGAIASVSKTDPAVMSLLGLFTLSVTTISKAWWTAGGRTGLWFRF